MVVTYANMPVIKGVVACSTVSKVAGVVKNGVAAIQAYAQTVESFHAADSSKPSIWLKRVFCLKDMVHALAAACDWPGLKAGSDSHAG